MTEISTTESTGIEHVLDAMVTIKARIPDDAMSASMLGTERSGHGIVIQNDGLIVTIGYLVTEAETVWIGTADRRTFPGYVVAVDYESGLGLVKPSMQVDSPCVALGSAGRLKPDDTVFIADSSRTGDLVRAGVIAKQEFVGRWEYLLDEAVYVAPPHPNWAGAALLDIDGRLCGIGSLLLQQTEDTATPTGQNLFVPIDLVAPVLEELCHTGKRATPARPWMGLLVHDEDEQLLVSGVYKDCPGYRAGLQPGDMLVRVNNRHVGSLAKFYRSVWDQGAAGVAVQLTVLRDGELRDLTVHTMDRNLLMRRQTLN